MKIIEAGHYYQAKGPTVWSTTGWQIMEQIKSPGDQTLLFIDDIHHQKNMFTEEVSLPVVDFYPQPDYLVMESKVLGEAITILRILKGLSKKKKARKGNNGAWFCSGFPITTPLGDPICVLLDAGLTLKKQSFGFKEAVNILPLFYEQEQRMLLRLIAKAMPEFYLRVILFNLEGEFWEILGD